MMNYESTYTQRLCRQYPGLFVILLDQSISMSEEVDMVNMAFMHGLPKTGRYGKYTKADIATAAINSIITTIAEIAGFGQATNQPKGYVYLCVLGYHKNIVPLVTKDDNRSFDPINIAELIKKKPNRTIPVEDFVQSSMGIVGKKINKPIWIEVDASGESTNMALAFEYARAIVDRWLTSPPELISPELGKQGPRAEGFPPVIINITDAEFNEGNSPLVSATAIQNNGTKDGKCLIFNCHFTTKNVQPTLFPADRNDVSHFDNYQLAQTMFDMSSPVPATLRPGATVLLMRPVGSSARSYVYNANPNILIRFLQWGTQNFERGTMPTRRW